MCVSAHGKKAGSEPKKRKSSVVVAKPLVCTPAKDKITSLKFIAKGDLLHGVSASPVKSGKEVPTVSYRSKICEKREKRFRRWESYNKVDKTIAVRTLCLSSTSEVVQSY